MPVNTERSDLEDYQQKWRRMRDCVGGRDALVAGGTAYVPDLPGNNAAMNASYRKRGNFFNATRRTVGGMTGAIFQESPRVEKFPETVKEYLKDLTLSNVSFEMFAAEAGLELMTVARYGVLVDMPSDATEKPRPYCVGY